MKILTIIFLFLSLNLSAQLQLGSHKVNIIIDDRIKHEYAGLIISVGSAEFSNHFLFNDKRPFTSACIGFSMGTLAGILKESVWDKRMHMGVCNNWDAVNTGWGALTGAFCVSIYFNWNQNKLSFYNKQRKK